MDENKKLYEEIKEELDENLDHPQDNMFLSAVLGQDEISVETIAAMWPNVSMGEFLEEMKRRGLHVTISRKQKEPAEKPSSQEETQKAHPAGNQKAHPDEIQKVHLTGEMEDTLENRERYLKLREMAREKMGDSGMVESFLEKEPQSLADAPLPEEALEELNAASYQGNFGELGELSKKLKENTQE